jgi:hypothetical protein
MASLAQNAEVPQVRRYRVFGPYIPVTLVVVIDCMGRAADDCSSESNFPGFILKSDARSQIGQAGGGDRNGKCRMCRDLK